MELEKIKYRGNILENIWKNENLNYCHLAYFFI